MPESFNAKVRTATKWSTLGEVAYKLVTPVSSMILARLLTPEAFGVVATLSMIISIAETITLRRVSHGQGVERIFPIHSPRIASFKVLRQGRVRRAKLYYLRDQVGAAAKIKEKRLH